MPNSHLVGSGCPICSKENKKAKNLTNEIFIKQAESLHGNKYDYSQVNYKNAHTKVKIICKTHGEFFTTPANHTNKNGYTGCPHCKSSKGEQKIKNILEKNNTEYIFQKTFKECKSKKGRIMPFDFYLPKHNICIEYDGEQHFHSVMRFGGEEGFKSIQKNDQTKTEYCKLNNIRLLRISYKENVENTLELLFKELSE